MKKIGILSVALLLSVVAFSNVTKENNKTSVADLESSTTDFINEKSNVKKVALRNASSENNAFNASKIYFQTAQDSEGYEYLRFATALRGSYSKVSYTRHIDGLGDKDSNVSVLYKGIAANGKVSYYDGSGLVDHDVTSTENYYWSCYTIRFKSDSTYKDSDITLTLNVDDNKYTDSRTISLNDAKNYVDDKKIDTTINEFKTYRMEAENLDFSQATLRDDFVAAGRTFIETPPAEYETSNGQSICGYKPGSIFEISLNLLEESTLYITSRMSDTQLDYKINEGVKFEMDSTLMTAEDVTFTFHGHPNYWEWKEVVIGKITLQAGVHTFKMTSRSKRPNIDYFQFETLKYGNKEKERVLEGIEVTTLPTKTKYEEAETFDPAGMVVRAKYSDYTYEEITDYTIDKTGPLTIADTEVTISYNGKSTKVAIEVDLKISSVGEHIFEAESMDLSNLVSDGSAFIENNDKSSGNASIVHIISGYINIDFKVSFASTLQFKGMFAKYEPVQLKDCVEIKVDGNVLDYENITLGRASDGSNDFFNFKECVTNKVNLTEGSHTLTITFKIGCNFDYANLIFETI